jgi:hypothetical protein
MGDLQNDGVIAIYDDPAHALLDFDSLIAFDAGIPFDSAVAAKTASGQIEIQRTHHAKGSSKVGHGAGAGLAVGLLVSLVPGIGLAAAAGGAVAGGAIGGAKRAKIRHAEKDQFLSIANDALDNGEALLAIVCAPGETERFDKLLTDAREVVQVNVAELPG